MRDLLTSDVPSDNEWTRILSLCDKVSLAMSHLLHYHENRYDVGGAKRVQTTEIGSFRSAVENADWITVLSEGRRLLLSCEGELRVELTVSACLALEHLGMWLSLAEMAEMGVSACEQYDIYDHRYANLLKSLGRGYWDRQLYDRATHTYEKLCRWAEDCQKTEDVYVALYSIACCLEKTCDGNWGRVVGMYEEVFHKAPEWSYRIAAAVNEVSLWMRVGDHSSAYELATTRFLAIPCEAREGASWAELLRVLAELEVYRLRPDVAEIIIHDALEIVPENRPAAHARCHAVRALVEHALGNSDEANEAVELAWMFAEMVPNADTCHFLREVETKIGRG